VVRVYDPHTETALVIKEFQRSGFDMNKPSIVGKDYHTEERVIGYYNTGAAQIAPTIRGEIRLWV
jgi:hypothetical protein